MVLLPLGLVSEYPPFLAQGVTMRLSRIATIVILALTLPVLLSAQNWTATTNYPVSESPIHSVSVGDVNGDHVMDVVFVNDSGAYVMPAAADGTLGKPSQIRAGVFDAVLDDFDGDGRPDLVVLGYASDGHSLGLFMLHNVGASFRESNEITTPPESLLGDHCRIGSGSFGADSRRDIVLVCPAQPGVVLIGRNSGSAAFIFNPVVIDQSRTLESVSAGDFDFDRHDDLVVVSRGTDGTVHTDIMYGRNDGFFTLARDVVPGGDVVIGSDFNGNGATDLIALDHGEVHAYVSKENTHTFDRPTAIPSANGCSVEAVSAGRIGSWRPGIRAKDIVVGQKCSSDTGGGAWGVGIYANTSATEMTVVPTPLFKKARYYYRLDVTVKALYGKGVPTGKVLLAAGSRTVKEVELVQGVASFEIQLTKGTNRIMAAYAGSASYAASSSGIIISANDQDKSNLPPSMEPYTTTKFRKGGDGSWSSGLFDPDRNATRFIRTVAGGWGINMGIGVYTAGPYIPGQSISFGGDLSSYHQVPSSCGADFTCWNTPVPDGSFWWSVDGASIGGGTETFNYNLYHCGTDRDGLTVYCEDDWLTEEITTSSIGPGTHSVCMNFVGYNYGPGNSYGDGVSCTTISIQKASPTISVGSSVNPSSYGQSITYTATLANSSSPSGTVTFKDGATTLGTGTISGTSASFTTPTLTAGTHSITAAYAGDSANNGVTSAVLSQTVNKAVLAVTANDASKTYGATNPGFSVTYAGFVLGQNAAVLSGVPSLTTTATTGSPVGTYTINATTGTLTSGNYTFTFVGGTLTITKAVLTVKANDASRAYGAANPVFTSTYSGFVNGDTAAVISGLPSLTTTATSVSSVGTYLIGATAGTLAATNYSFSFVAGTLTITKANVTITWATPAPITYGTPLSSTQLNATASVPGTFAYSPSSGTLLSAGAQTLGATFTPTDSTNYNTGNTSVVLTVNKATSTVGVTSTLNPSRFGDTVTFQVTVSGSGAVPTGTVVITDAGTTIGTVTLDGTGKASYTTSALVAGSHPLLISYGGNGNYN